MRSIYQAAIISLFSLAIISCQKKENNELAHHHEAEEEESHSHSKGEIVIEPETARQFGITVEKAKLKPFHAAINVSGELIASPANESIISAPTAGVVTLNSSCIIGNRLSAGQTIGTLTAKNELGDNPNTLTEAEIKAAKSEVDRLRPLLDDGIVTNGEFQAAVNAYNQAKASYSKAAASGVIKSLKAGTVAEVFALSGQFVTTGQAIARLTDDRVLILRADVPEQYSSQVGSINSVEIKEAHAGEWADLSTRHLKRLDRNDSQMKQGYKPIYYLFDNNGEFSAGSFVDVMLRSENATDCIVVPSTAISEQQGENYLYVKTGEHAYVKRKVQLGNVSGNEVEVLSGISEGEEIVVNGVNSVKMAESSGAVPEGHSHNH